MFSPYSHSGFYNSPVSKGLLGTVVVTSFALNVPFHNYRPYFIYSQPHIFQEYEVWRLFTAKLAFLDTKDLICGALLIYYFRIFERRYGSHKFASYLLATSTLSTCLELMTSAVCRHFNVNVNLLPSGPYGLVFALFVPYYADIPRVAITHILGVPVTGKSFMYILGLQICSSSLESLLVAVCGLISGCLYRWNALRVQRWLKFPSVIARLLQKTIGRLLKSPEPDQTLPMGATLELQRQQEVERLEQQLAWQAAREFNNIQRNQRMREPHLFEFPQPPPYVEEGRFGEGPGRFGDGPPPPDDTDDERPSTSSSHSSGVSEQQIERLVEMGFARENALRALRTSHNDLNTAMNILLQDAS